MIRSNPLAFRRANKKHPVTSAVSGVDNQGRFKFHFWPAKPARNRLGVLYRKPLAPGRNGASPLMD
jgi:hypothetical protein